MAIYYTDNTGGNNANPGTLAEPWETLVYSVSQLSPGDNLKIRGGTYSENTAGAILYVDVSGTSDSRITIENYTGETVNLLSAGASRGIYIAADYVTVSGLHSDQGTWGATDLRYHAQVIGNHNIITSCLMKYTSDAATGLRGIQISGSWNQILDNEIGEITRYDDGDEGYGEGIWLTDSAGYNLIQGNTVYNCSHNCIFLNGAHHNIIRENTFYNDCWRTAGANGLGLDDKHNIFEDNIFHDNAGTSDWGPKVSGFQNASGHTIFRRNKMYDLVGAAWTASGFYDGGDCYSENAYYYHNSCYNLGTEPTAYSAAMECGPDNAAYVTNIHVVNNIFYVYSHNQGNVFYYNEGSSSMIDDRGNWWGTTDGNPLYTSPSTGVLTLQSGSACRNNGAWLTTITSTTGSGVSFVVDDALYFTDGMGIIDGDIIQIEGQTQTARITGVNYTTNTITVNTTLSWTQGDGLALAYDGAAPDQGYIEHPEGSTEFIYYGNIPITVTPASTYEGTTFQQNVTDGGFEYWDDAVTPTYWDTDLYGTSTVNREASVIHGGTYACRLDIDASNEIASVQNFTVTLVSGNQYQISFWYKMSAGSKTAQFSLRDDTATVFLDENGDWTSTPWYTVALINKTDWFQFTLNFTAHASYTAYFFEIFNASAASASIYVDDLSFTQILNENVYVGSIPITVGVAGEYVQDFAYEGNIPITVTPESLYTFSNPAITVPGGEEITVFNGEVYRIIRIQKNMGDMTCDIVAVKVSEGSEA